MRYSYQFIASNSLYMLRALMCSSSGGTVYTAIGKVLWVLCRLAASRLGVEWFPIIPIVCYTEFPSVF
jgi:hypothetical protein